MRQLPSGLVPLLLCSQLLLPLCWTVKGENRAAGSHKIKGTVINQMYVTQD
jgi:hypothetical protein